MVAIYPVRMISYVVTVEDLTDFSKVLNIPCAGFQVAELVEKNLKALFPLSKVTVKETLPSDKIFKKQSLQNESDSQEETQCIFAEDSDSELELGLELNEDEDLFSDLGDVA